MRGCREPPNREDMQVGAVVVSARTGAARWLPMVLLACGAGVMAALFFHLASEVNEGETQTFDAFFLHAAHQVRIAHPWIADVMRDLSGLGSPVTLVVATLAACGYLALTTSFARSAFVAFAVVAGAVGVALFKAGFARSRPDIALAEFIVTGPSFPSGHSSMAAVVFLTLGALVARMHRRRRDKAYVMGVAVFLTVLVGVSRAALGVHWATDVLGGWALGIAWSTACLLVARNLER